jgi:Zn-dependent peptidase ImmA (M78 family)
VTKKLGFHTLGVQPTVLRWARESQGYSLDDVAIHLKRDIDEIIAWETGAASPTYAQLESLAYGLYKRPLAVFFLPTPPKERKVKQEFRTLPDSELERLAADTRYQLRLAQAYQISLRELNDGMNPSARKIFRDLALTVKDTIKHSGDRVRAYLGIGLDAQIAWQSPEAALKAWRTGVEANGVFVFKHSFKQKAISGFCLADDEFPLIYLNNSTAETRQIFSLIHELAHLLLKVSAISTVDDIHLQDLPPKERVIEQFCNALAAEILVPSADFEAQLAGLVAPYDDAVLLLARRYHVSRESILRRFLDRGLID